MKPKEKRRTRCHGCGRTVPNYEIISYGSAENSYRELCTKCFNTEIAESEALEGFEHAEFEPVKLIDCAGRTHTFHFRTRLFVPGVALDAFELRDGLPGGYQFQIIGDPNDDLMALLARLLERIRRALSIKHLRKGDLGLQIADNLARGTIGWDPDADGRVPLLTIDGRDITWNEFGRMLMTFEGWQFKLDIRDKSEEI
jgi:hypothetical protein